MQGDLIIDSKLHLDGSFEGLLDCASTLVVGKNGECRGRMRAEEVLVSGRLEGDLVCDKLHILSGGRVKGRVFCETFLVDERGSFTGERNQAGEQIKMLSEAEELLEQPLAAIKSPEVTLENLLESLPTSVKIDD